MALVLADRVQETTNTTGIGTLTLAGAVSGYQSFSAIGNANTTYYTIQSGTDWEVGLGTYTSAGTTLSRDTVLASSAGGTTKITVAAGARVFCDYPAVKAAYIDGNTTLTVPTLACNTVNSVTPVLSFNASNSIASFGSTTANSYNQLVIQNKSNAATSSTNYVLSNDLGTDTTFYGEFGMNSSGYTATGTYPDFFSMNSGVYVSTHDGDLTVGSGNGFKTYFAWGTTGQSAHVINASGAIGLNTNLGTSAATTGTSNFGTSGQVLTSGGSAATPTWTTPTTGTVTSVGGTGTVNGLTLTGTVTSTGNLTLGGTLDLSSPPTIGNTTANTGRFSTLAATGVFTASAGTSALPSIVTSSGSTTGLYSSTANVLGVAVSAASIGTFTSTGLNGMAVGATTASTGSFTTLGASGAVTLSPASAAVAISPTGTGTVAISPAGALTVNPTAASTINNCSIGVTTNAAGRFTTLTATAAVTLSPASAAVAISPTGTGTVAISPAGALTVNPTAASTINNTSIGVTTAAAGRFTGVTSTGNMTFTGTGNLITGDFSNATIDSRVRVQSSTTNGLTDFTLVPNGTSNFSAYVAFGSSTTATGPFCALSQTGGATLLQNGGTGASTINVTAGTLGVSLASGGTSWTSLSDETQKDIIEPIANGVDKVAQLRSVIGKYKEDKEAKRRPFLIAQDVQKVLPEAVLVQDEATGVLGLSYTDVIPLLVSAINELSARVKELEAKVI